MNSAAYLKPTYFLNFDHSAVREFAMRNSDETASHTTNAIRLFEAVRDSFSYNPYKLDLRRAGLQASNLVSREHGYCVEKAVLLAACARAIGIPSRLFFGNVRNHIATERLQKTLGTDVMVFHGSAELFLNGNWIKTTPAFDTRLCERIGVEPLAFDGENDCIFQQFDPRGRRYMEYLHEYGSFDDLPYETYLSELQKAYAHLSDRVDFADEATLKMDFTPPR